MPTNGNDAEAEHDVSRRRYVQAIMASTAAGLAGCNQGGDDESGGNTTTTTDSGDGSDGTTTEETTTTRGPPVSDTITSSINNTAAGSNLNRWAASPTNAGIPWFRELLDPRDIPQGKSVVYNGAEFEVPHFPDRDTIQLPTLTNEFRSEPPYDRYWDMAEGFSYWDGTPLDAEAKLRHDAMFYYTDNQKFAPAATFNNEVVDQYEYHWWRNKGEVEGQEPDPTNKPVLDANIVTETPFHPSFTTPYYQKFQDASNTEAVNGIISNLEGDNVSFGRLADEGWGSGLYRVESSDDVSAEKMTAGLRDDHPNDFATIPKLELRFASADRRQVLKSQGEIDIGGGAVLEQGGTTNREMLPDYIQEVDRFLQSGSDNILFNFNNKHIARIGVRHAMVAAVDWEQASVNGWGSGRTLPQEDHTGLLQTVSEGFFSDEFLDTLYKWPMNADTELATRWMRKAGYTMENGIWTDSQGDQVDLNFISSAGIADWTGFVQTVQSQLQDFGFKVGLNNLEGSNYNDALRPKNLNYDIAQFWGPGVTQPFEFYRSDGTWWGEWLVGGDANDPVIGPVDPETTGPDTTHDTVDIKGHPLEVRIPNDPKNIDITPEGAGANPALPESESMAIDVVDLIDSLRDPDITQEEYMKNCQLCARYYNYHLPLFRFHQYTWGVWGNVRDFTFPPEGHKLNRIFHEFSGDDFEVLAGVVGTKFDEEYEQP